MSKKTLIIMGSLIVAVLAVFGITKYTGTSGVKEGETITITHDLGEIEVKVNPERVVVFDFGILDGLDALDVEIIGTAKSSKIPEFLNKYNDEKYLDLGDLKEPNMEKIFEAKPDLIIISARMESYYEELSKIAPTLYMPLDNTDYMASFENNMRTLGQIFDKENQVEKELKEVKESVATVKEKATEKDSNALITLANDGAFSVYGEGSRFGIIHGEFGIEAVDKTIETSTHGQKASFEYVVEKNPDYIFVVDRTAVVGGESSAKAMFDNELIKKTEAYKNGRIVYLDAQVWYTANGGFNSTKMMVEEIMKALEI